MSQKVLLPSRKVFSDVLFELAKKDKEIIVLTSDSRGSASVENFAKYLPEQFIDVGIAEQNLVSIASGLAGCGKKPFVFSPACFLTTRSIEQIKIDVAYTNRNVKLIGVSGGVSYGPLGSTHHALEDIAFMRAIPNMTVVLPSDTNQVRVLVEKLILYTGPVYVRIGRNPIEEVYSSENIQFEIGKGNILLDGDEVTIIATGEMVKTAYDAGILLRSKGIYARVVDMHTIKPIDEELIIESAKKTKFIVTIEEHNIRGGLGSAVAEVTAQNFPVKMIILGIPDEFSITGSQKEILEYYGLTSENICGAILRELKEG
ncbi:MAG: transketolase family protein [bacterium]|nr:transketolase family protein [bacterium]